MKNKKLISLILLCILIIGCSNSKKNTDISNITNEQSSKSIIIPITTDSININPSLIKTLVDKNIVAQIFDTITYINQNQNKASTLLAVEYSHTDDYKTWNFELRDDINTSDDRPITSEMAKKCLEKSDISSKFRIETKNNSLIFHSEIPEFNLDEILADPKYAIYDTENNFDDITNISYTGAYKIKSKTDTYIELERNPKYWDDVNTKIDNIKYEIQEDAELADQMLSQDLYDIYSNNLYNIPKYKLKSFKTNPNILVTKGNNIIFIHFNPNGAFSDINIRQALIKSMERQTLVNLEFTGDETPITAVFDKNSYKDYDVDVANEYFSKTSYKENKDTVHKIIIRSTPPLKQVASLILTNWYKLYRLPISGKVLDDNAFFEAIKSNDYDIAIDIYSPESLQSDRIFEYIVSKYNDNINFNYNSKDDFKISLENAEKYLLDNALYSPIYKNVYIQKINENIKFMSMTSQGISYIRDIER